MLLTCLGHAKFLIELNSGLRIVTDPFDAACGYPLTETQADVVLVSHGHHDHSAVETISGNPRIIREAGTYTLESGVTVTAIPAAFACAILLERIASAETLPVLRSVSRLFKRASSSSM